MFITKFFPLNNKTINSNFITKQDTQFIKQILTFLKDLYNTQFKELYDIKHIIKTFSNTDVNQMIESNQNTYLHGWVGSLLFPTDENLKYCYTLTNISAWYLYARLLYGFDTTPEGIVLNNPLLTLKNITNDENLSVQYKNIIKTSENLRLFCRKESNKLIPGYSDCDCDFEIHFTNNTRDFVKNIVNNFTVDEIIVMIKEDNFYLTLLIKELYIIAFGYEEITDEIDLWFLYYFLNKNNIRLDY